MLDPAAIDQQTGLHHHLKLNVTLSAEASGNFSLCVQCDDDHSGVAISVLVDVTAGALAVVVSLGGITQPVNLLANAAAGPVGEGVHDRVGATVTVSADVFTDGLITELFAGSGQVALSHTVGSVVASGVGYIAYGSPARVEIELWGMEQSVF